MPKPNLPVIETKFEVFNEVGQKRARMNLIGTIRPTFRDEDEGKYISAARVIRELDKLNDKDVDIYVYSRGGDVFESVEIRNRIKEYKGDVEFYVLSMAGSGASVILTAREKVNMYSNATQVAHNMWTSAQGNAKELRRVADDLDNLGVTVFNSYKDKFAGTDEELKQLLDYDGYLTAQQCLAYGFCSRIIDAEPQSQTPQADVAQALFAKYGGSIQNSTPHVDSVPDPQPQEEHPQPQNGLFANFKF